MKVSHNKTFSVHLRLAPDQVKGIEAICSRTNLTFCDCIRAMIDYALYFSHGGSHDEHKQNDIEY